MIRKRNISELRATIIILFVLASTLFLNNKQSFGNDYNVSNDSYDYEVKSIYDEKNPTYIIKDNSNLNNETTENIATLEFRY